MKELTIEEKAKRYDEAIEKAKKFHKECKIRGNDWFVEDIEEMFPELKESKDERIRGKITATIKLYYGEPLEDEAKEMIAWLEKQCENTYNKELSELLHKVICRFINDPDIPYSDREKVSMKVLPYVELLEKQVEKKHTDGVEPKFREGDVMRTLEEAKDGWIDGMPVVVSIDNEYYHCTNEIIPIVNQDKYEYPPTNRKQKAWSEEDEKMIDNIIDYMRPMPIFFESTKGKSGKEYTKEFIKDAIDWLKSLRLQTTWKPGDKQMENLSRAVNGGTYRTSLLMELYQDLKKLKG